MLFLVLNEDMRNFLILLLVLFVSACSNGSDKAKIDTNTADGQAIQKLFDQMVKVDKTLQSLQKDILAISSAVKKAKTKNQKEKLGSELIVKLNEVFTVTRELDNVKIPDINSADAKKYLIDVVALQKEWGNNQRAKYLAAIQGNAAAIAHFQDEADTQALQIVMLYENSAQAVKYKMKTLGTKN